MSKPGPDMELTELIEQARRHLAAVTGLKPVTMTGVHQDGEGWHVGMEMLELARIPPATDVLAEYDALFSQEGELLRFDRKRSRLRGETREAGSGG